MRPIPLLLGAALVLAGCSHATSQRYDAADVGRTIETTEASVISSRPVQISGQTDVVGPAAGGILGAAGSGLIFDKGWAAVIGGVLGAGVGYLTQQQVNEREGIEYVLRMNDGRTVTLVQNREGEEQPLPDGTPVLVQISGQYTRVIEDPRAERRNGPGWVDPDVAPPAATTGAAAAVPGAPIRLGPPPEPLPPVGQQQ